jgi:hypothetical protein
MLYLMATSAFPGISAPRARERHVIDNGESVEPGRWHPKYVQGNRRRIVRIGHQTRTGG